MWEVNHEAIWESLSDPHVMVVLRRQQATATQNGKAMVGRSMQGDQAKIQGGM
jgi:hypothetical protein